MGNTITKCCEKFFSSKKPDSFEKLTSIRQLDKKDINITETKNEKKIPLLELKELHKTKNPIKEKENYDKKEYQNKQFTHKVTLNDFKILKTLGKGAFGKVLLVHNEELNKYFAMKILKKDFIKKNKQIAHTKVERKILEKIDYPFIAQLFYAFQNKEKLYMITEYMPGGEMFYHLHKEEYFKESKAKFYICEIILAIEHLHKNNIIYRDLKPENILLDENGHIKLTDFGLSKIVNDINKDRTFTICGTPEYVAPEVLTGKGYNKSVDWWSLGIVLYEMLCGNSPFREARERIDIEIYFKPIHHDNLISDIAFDLINKLIEPNCEKRLGYGIMDSIEIKNHVFFKDINWKKVERKEIEPEYKPVLKKPGDVSNFDTIFTDMDPYSYKDRGKLINQLNKKNKGNSPSDGISYENFTYVKNII